MRGSTMVGGHGGRTRLAYPSRLQQIAAALPAGAAPTMITSASAGTMSMRCGPR